VIGGGEIEDLIRHNKVSGGMILKLEAAKRALAAGISEVRIVGGTLPKSLLSAASGAILHGTRVLPILHSSASAAHGAAPVQ
jgi:acetylglutamate kinase